MSHFEWGGRVCGRGLAMRRLESARGAQDHRHFCCWGPRVIRNQNLFSF